eukprot:jgi/Bigna1/55467/estExt_Genewise1Plus.C_600073
MAKRIPQKRTDLPVNFNQTVALVKEAFDRKYGPTWHCIIGRNFGSKVTHESKTFLYVKLNQQLKMLVFKS